MSHQVCSELGSSGDSSHGLLLVDGHIGMARECVSRYRRRYGERRALLGVLCGGIESVHGS